MKQVIIAIYVVGANVCAGQKNWAGVICLILLALLWVIEPLV